MREIRPSGSEGGGTQPNESSLPLCAWVGEHGQRGGSPLQVDVLRPVADRNCVAARRGGEHREANGQSATRVNSIRPGCLASLPSYGEAQIGAIRKPTTLKGNVSKRSSEQSGGWRRNGRKSKFIKPRDLSRQDGPCASCSGVRAFIVAMKPGNSGGAKGRRKVDARSLNSLNPTQPLFPGPVSRELKPGERVLTGLSR